MRIVLTLLVAALVAAPSAHAGALKCAADAVKVGNVCVDKYEASVWLIDPITNKSLIKKVQSGKATLTNLTVGGATQLSPSLSCTPGFPLSSPATGNWTPIPDSSPPSPGIYAVSIPGVLPTACVTWFQAEQACALSGKRLATNQEWQLAAAGTPDGAPCVVSAMGPSNTGANPGCVSVWGAFDMVGNAFELVAEWGDLANGCTNWVGAFGGDLSCVGGPGSGFTNAPGMIFRGGFHNDGANAGVFAIDGDNVPSDSFIDVGFRCAR